MLKFYYQWKYIPLPDAIDKLGKKINIWEEEDLEVAWSPYISKENYLLELMRSYPALSFYGYRVGLSTLSLITSRNLPGIHYSKWENDYSCICDITTSRVIFERVCVKRKELKQRIKKLSHDFHIKERRRKEMKDEINFFFRIFFRKINNLLFRTKYRIKKFLLSKFKTRH